MEASIDCKFHKNGTLNTIYRRTHYTLNGAPVLRRIRRGSVASIHRKGLPGTESGRLSFISSQRQAFLSPDLAVTYRS